MPGPFAMDNLVEAARTVGLLARARIQAGQVPLFLGVPGLIALLYDKLRRYTEHTDQQELVSMASDALIIVAMAIGPAQATVPATPLLAPGGETPQLSDEEYQQLVESLRDENKGLRNG